MCYHSHADDTQEYVSFKPGMEETKAQHRLECCLADVRLWMAANFLKLNDDKTDVLIVGSKSNLDKSDLCGIKIGQTQVEPSNNVKNIGVGLIAI